MRIAWWLAGVVGLAALGLGATRIDPAAPPPTARAIASPEAASNIYAADYVGPDACGDCHPENHRRWQASLHATMNRRAADPSAIRGDFADVSIAYGGGTVALSPGPTMTLRRGTSEHRFRITRTIGSRALQEYVGVEVGADGRDRGDEVRLPFGYSLRARRWLPRVYFDSWYPAEYRADGSLAVDPYQPDDEPWAARCAWCHNTYPFELRALRSRDREVGYGLEQYYDLVVDRRPAEARIAIAHNRLPVDELVTVGISCESCHLGGRDHAEREPIDDLAPGAPDSFVAGPAPARSISFVPTSSDLRRHVSADPPALAGGRHDPVVVDAICAQCHSTPSPRFVDGGAQRNSSEALDLAAGACAPALACTACHDPHQAGPGPGAPDQPGHLAACTGCHRELATPSAARAHGGHDAVSCLDCHMPRIVQGIGGFVRSHRISSPADPAMLADGAPNACNLCHLDRSIRWTLEALAARGDVISSDDAWQRGYPGGLDAPVGPQWLGSDRAVLRITAAAAYARSPAATSALPMLIAILDDPVAYDRMWLLWAIEAALRRPLAPGEYDPLAPPPVRAEQHRRLMARWPLRAYSEVAPSRSSQRVEQTR